MNDNCCTGAFNYISIIKDDNWSLIGIIPSKPSVNIVEDTARVIVKDDVTFTERKISNVIYSGNYISKF